MNGAILSKNRAPNSILRIWDISKRSLADCAVNKILRVVANVRESISHYDRSLCAKEIGKGMFDEVSDEDWLFSSSQE